MMTNKHLSTCCRCLKKTDGIHTCTPSAGWRKLEEQRDELLAALEEALPMVAWCGSFTDDKLTELAEGGHLTAAMILRHRATVARAKGGAA